jgi:hypothetical protein
MQNNFDVCGLGNKKSTVEIDRIARAIQELLKANKAWYSRDHWQFVSNKNFSASAKFENNKWRFVCDIIPEEEEDE